MPSPVLQHCDITLWYYIKCQTCKQIILLRNYTVMYILLEMTLEWTEQLNTLYYNEYTAIPGTLYSATTCTKWSLHRLKCQAQSYKMCNIGDYINRQTWLEWINYTLCNQKLGLHYWYVLEM